MLSPEVPVSGPAQDVAARMAMQEKALREKALREKKWGKDALEGRSVPGDDTLTSIRHRCFGPHPDHDATGLDRLPRRVPAEGGWGPSPLPPRTDRSYDEIPIPSLSLGQGL